MLPEKVLLVVRLMVVLAFAVINGIDLAFNVYAVILKETFNLTQTQVEITASMSSIGYGMAFIEPMLTGVYGYSATFAFTWIAFPSSCGLFAITAVYKDFFHHWPVFLYIAQLTMSAACNIGYIAVTRIVMEILPDRFTGTFLGVFGTAVCFGKIFVAGLNDVFFLNDMAGFFWCLTALGSLIYGVCFMMIYRIAVALERKPNPQTNGLANVDAPITNVKHILHSRFFHMMFWSVTAFMAISANMLNNITSVTDSMYFKDYFNTVTIMSLSIMATRILFGFAYDRCSSLSSAFLLLFVGYFSQTLALFVGMYYLNSTTIYLVTILFGIGHGSSIYLPLTMFIYSFGLESYRFISSLIFAVSAVNSLVIQVITGILYDAEIPQNGIAEHRCYGPDCFFWSFAIQLSVTILVMLLQAVNFLMTVHYPCYS